MNGRTRVSCQRDAKFPCRGRIERKRERKRKTPLARPWGDNKRTRGTRAAEKNTATAYSIVCNRRIVVVVVSLPRSLSASPHKACQRGPDNASDLSRACHNGGVVHVRLYSSESRGIVCSTLSNSSLLIFFFFARVVTYIKQHIFPSNFGHSFCFPFPFIL